MTISTALFIALTVAAAPSQPAQAAPVKEAKTVEKAKPKDADRALRRAYQKEFAFLDAQKRELKRLLEKADGDLQQLGAKATAQEAALERDLLARRMHGDDVARDLEVMERDAASSDEQNPVGSVLSQIDQLLVRAAPREGEPTVDDLHVALKSALGLVAERSSARAAAGAFFDATGKKVEGRVVHIGEVAAFGTSPHAAGALLPAGAGALKLMPEAEDAATQAANARALVDGAVPPRMGLFLYETADKAVEQRPEKTALEIVQSGGSIAWVIVGLGLLSLLLMLGRVAILAALGRGREYLLETVRAGVKAGAVQEALAACRTAPGAMGPVLAAALSTLDGPRIVHEDAIDEAMIRQGAKIDRFSTLILVSAAVAPLLGLLGTVTGMIATFDTITEFGTGDPRMLSGGISEALVTTELGLIVAIPSLLVGNLLAGWGERIKRDLDSGALSIANAHAENAALDLDDDA